MLPIEEMLHSEQLVRAKATRWLGSWHPLVRQIGVDEGIARADGACLFAGLDPQQSLAALGSFLQSYKDKVLIPHELPVLAKAHQHAARNELRELLELDARLDGESWMEPYRDSSQTAGRAHLERLRPLRDQRLVQRFLRHVENDSAHGWHVLVAGLALSLYSIPPRQGLMDYAVHTLWNAVRQASGSLQLTSEEAQALVREVAADLPQRLQSLFRQEPVIGI